MRKKHFVLLTSWGICVGSEVKICAKYAQNMRNPKNGVGSATPYLITQALLLQNMVIFFIRKNPQGTFFFQKTLVFWGIQKFGGLKIFIWTYYFRRYAQNMRKYFQICAIVKKRKYAKNMRKYAEICAAHITPLLTYATQLKIHRNNSPLSPYHQRDVNDNGGCGVLRK